VPWALGGILLLATALRFLGLPAGLRHVPHWDERVFVEAVGQMRAAGDLDHRFYEYPGLFVYLLWGALLPVEMPPGPTAYLVGRGLVAVSGLASVALVYLLGRRLAGPWAGLAGASLAAVSPIEVVTSHMIRPDVTLETLALLALLSFTRLGEGRRGDTRAGVALGAAASIKLTGALLVPSYLLARWLAPAPRLRPALRTGGIALAVLVVTTPYAIFHWRQFLGGIGVQLGAHYEGGAEGPPFSWSIVRYYLGILGAGLGPIGVVLATAGFVLALRAWRAWGPLLVHPLATLLVLSTADIRYLRHMVPVTGVVSLLAGLAVARLGARRPRWALALAVAAPTVPLADSAGYVFTLRQPSTWDRTVDWLHAHAPGARVLSTVPELGVDPHRLEVVPATGRAVLDRRLALDVDYVAWTGPPAALLGGLRPAFVAEAWREEAGPPMSVYLVPEALRPRFQAVTLDASWLSASENGSDLPNLLDGRPTTYWTTSAPQRPGSWIEVGLPAPVVLGRIELELGRRPQRSAAALRLLVSDDGLAFRTIEAAAARAPVDAQSARPVEPSQVLVFPPTSARALRLEQTGTSERRWGVSELRLLALGG
jgi:hypothetical protein